MARTNQSQAEIQALVQDFTDQLTQLVRRTALEQVHAALGQLDGAAGARPGRKPVRRAGRRSGRRSPAAVEQMSGRLLAFVKKNPGRRGEQISKALRTDVGTMRLPMKSLIAKKKVKTKGQRRGMTYFAA